MPPSQAWPEAEPGRLEDGAIPRPPGKQGRKDDGHQDVCQALGPSGEPSRFGKRSSPVLFGTVLLEIMSWRLDLRHSWAQLWSLSLLDAARGSLDVSKGDPCKVRVPQAARITRG